MKDPKAKLTRRKFICDSVALTAVISTGTRVMAAAQLDGSGFKSGWHHSLDRVWLGADMWANPLQDWRIQDGRLECIGADSGRNVQLLTWSLAPNKGSFTTGVRIGRLEGTKLAQGEGSAGFLLGINGSLRDYRHSLIFGKGLNAGLTAAGGLFIGDIAQAVAGTVDLSGESVELQLTAVPAGATYELELTVHESGSGRVLGKLRRDGIPAGQLEGNVALAANFGIPRADMRSLKAPPPGDGGRFWFADWWVHGSKLAEDPGRSFGPILFSQYTVHEGILKMTAQMPPLGAADAPTVRLQLKKGTTWTTVVESPIDGNARTATFRVEKWDATRDTPYRVAYGLRARDGEVTEHYWNGTVRHDPVEQEVITVADICCNVHEAFPNTLYTRNVAALNPDLLAFVGDQFYEISGGFGTQRVPLDAAMLDYLRKWYLHGWTWRDLMRDRPSISLPDDHDVYQGNVWGEGGAPVGPTLESGGYEMPVAWVNVVHRTNASHHPDAWDPTPAAQGMSVYGGALTYGRVSFAIVADRQFKSGPDGKVPPTGTRADHVYDPNFDPATSDTPGLQLLGESQLRFIRSWARDWRGADLKAVISQTTFTAMATTHGSERARLIADYDTNGWPRKERNAALREIRKAFALHIAGDQHLPAVVHYGIEEHGDAGVGFAGPAMNTGYPRWFEPLHPGANRAPGAPDNTGEFVDSFGHPLTVLAVANGAIKPRADVLHRLQDKASGIGIVRCDKRRHKFVIECWPLLADVSQSRTQFPGWPVEVDVLDNYARRPAAHLPALAITGVERPVLQVFDERDGELVYALRLATPNFSPPVFAQGFYTIRVGDPDTKRWSESKNIEALPGNTKSLRIKVS